MRLRRPLLLALLGPLTVLALGGCAVQRSVTIDTDPTGADIWVNGTKMAGKTPVTVPFTHYGRFDVRVERVGYHSVAADVVVNSQLDGYPLVDLPFEIAGGTKRFRRVVRMVPLGSAAEPAVLDGVMGRARGLRKRTHDEVVEPGTPGRQAPEFVK